MMAQAGALGRFEKSGSKISSTTRGEGDGLWLRQFLGNKFRGASEGLPTVACLHSDRYLPLTLFGDAGAWVSIPSQGADARRMLGFLLAILLFFLCKTNCGIFFLVCSLEFHLQKKWFVRGKKSCPGGCDLYYCSQSHLQTHANPPVNEISPMAFPGRPLCCLPFSRFTGCF